MDRLLRKHRRAAKAVPEPVIRMQTDATFGIISLGGCDPAVREAVAVLAERGIVADYMRIRAFPFGDTSRSSWLRTTASSLSSRTATRS
jgi:2-oxoglutarate ferredoxin oxidoreductase subunit alpha